MDLARTLGWRTLKIILRQKKQANKEGFRRRHLSTNVRTDFAIGLYEPRGEWKLRFLSWPVMVVYRRPARVSNPLAPAVVGGISKRTLC